MLDKDYSSKEWTQLWKDLDSLKPAPSMAEETGKKYEFKHSKISSKDFGTGASMMANYADPIRGLQADIRKGHGHIEFTPSLAQGSGVGSFSKLGFQERRALREIKKANDISISTHADANVSGLTGFNPNTRNFEEETRSRGISKIKEAIDFAADVAEGGSVTLHSGDFTRPLDGGDFGSGANFSRGDEQKNLYLGLIDEDSNSFVKESVVKVDEELIVPVKGSGFIEFEDMDVSGLKIRNLETEGGKVKIEKFNNFKEYAASLLKNDSKFSKIVKDKLMAKDKSLWNKLEKDLKSNRLNEVSDYRVLELAAKQKFIDDQQLGLLNKSNSTLSQYNKQKTEITNLISAVDSAKEKSKSESDLYLVPKDMRSRSIKPISISEFLASNSNINSEADLFGKHKEVLDDFIIVDGDRFLDSDLNEVDDSKIKIEGFLAGDYLLKNSNDRLNEVQYLIQDSKSHIEKMYSKLKDLETSTFKTISEVAEQQNKKSFGEIGLELYEKNKQLKSTGKDNIYLSIENLFPEFYGSHPKELLDIIKTARTGMKDKLISTYNLDEKEAAKVANSSIKATFDTGHLHMWKKYFKRKDRESDDDYNKRFNDWALSQTKELVDSGVIGNVHLADNFGFDDDHITLGQGTVPIKEYMELFDKARAEGKVVGKFAVEGFDDRKEREGVIEAWKQTGVQLFRTQQATDRWINFEDDIGTSYGIDRTHNSYLGSANKPYFIFGKYAPATDPNDWAPWDELGLE